jgi:hypothetical protein
LLLEFATEPAPAFLNLRSADEFGRFFEKWLAHILGASRNTAMPDAFAFAARLRYLAVCGPCFDHISALSDARHGPAVDICKPLRR